MRELKLHELSKEDLVTLALMLALSYRRGDVWVFEGHKHNVKLMKLLFLVAHGVFDEDGRIVDLRPEPRLNMDFVVYLSGVATSQVYDVQMKLQLDKIVARDDFAYSVFTLPGDITLDTVLSELEKISETRHSSGRHADASVDSPASFTIFCISAMFVHRAGGKQSQQIFFLVLIKEFLYVHVE